MRRLEGAALLEVLFALGLLALMLGLGTGASRSFQTHVLNVGAARWVRTLVRTARLHAVREGVHAALAFEAENTGEYRVTIYADGNGNGVRWAEVRSGVDPPLSTPARSSDRFAATAIRIDRDVPSVDGGGSLRAGNSPVRLSGGSMLLSLGPTGTATAGTVYVSGAQGAVLAVRTTAATGRVRLFEFVEATASWVERW